MTTPWFSLSPKHPVHSVPPSTEPTAFAYQSCFGVTFGSGNYSLEAQYAADEAVFHSRHHLVDAAATSPAPYGSVNSVQIAFLGYNVTTENQYLLIFDLEGHNCQAKIYVNRTLVQTEPLSGTKQVSLLIDCPGPEVYTYITIEHAKTPEGGHGYMRYRGVDCYLV